MSRPIITFLFLLQVIHIAAQDTLIIHWVESGETITLEFDSLNQPVPTWVTPSKKVVDTVAALGELGYPMAKARASVLGVRNDTIFLSLHLDSGPKLRFGGFEQTGLIRPENRYLQAITNIKVRDLYSDSLFRAISQNVLRTNLYVLSREPQIRFSIIPDSNFVVILDIKQRQKSSVWGLAGLSPGQAEGSLRLTGEAQAHVIGLMNHGDEFSFRWSSSGKGSQELKTHLSYPYLLGIRLGIDAGFQLKKIDTLFFNREFSGNIFFQSNPETRSGIKYTRWSSNELYATERESKKQMVGLTYQLRKLDAPFNPSKGIFLDLTAESGLLKQQGNEQEDSIWNRIGFQSHLQVYRPLSPLLVLHLALDGASILGTSVSEQEMYRIGGANLLRGFDEESQVISSYACATLSLRVRPDEYTFFGIFLDQAYLDKEISEGFYSGFGIEAGIGIPAGMLILQYALGKQPEVPLNLSAGRVHVGLRGNF